MALLAFDVRHKTHTTSVMLLIGSIQTVVLQMFFFGSRRHGALLQNSAGHEA
jgi:hypothetical protein